MFLFYYLSSSTSLNCPSTGEELRSRTCTAIVTMCQNVFVSSSSGAFTALSYRHICIEIYFWEKLEKHLWITAEFEIFQVDEEIALKTEKFPEGKIYSLPVDGIDKGH